MLVFATHSADETFELGRRIGLTLQPGDIILLRGDLGAGKSVLARGLARGLGIDCPMPSPTFTLMVPYVGQDNQKLYHFDLYRMDDPDEFYQAGLQEYIGGDGIAVVEWPEMAELEPAGAVKVNVLRSENDDDERIIEVSAPESVLSGMEAWRIDG
jgi:tRNA threonylcarbamoyladenosine biosynthesis protein TsaE